MTYKLIALIDKFQMPSVLNLETFGNIPFDPANRDFIKFKQDIANGVELQDADGNIITDDALTQFMKGLP
jgi:hypothetical protein